LHYTEYLLSDTEVLFKVLRLKRSKSLSCWKLDIFAFVNNSAATKSLTIYPVLLVLSQTTICLATPGVDSPPEHDLLRPVRDTGSTTQLRTLTLLPRALLATWQFS